MAVALARDRPRRLPRAAGQREVEIGDRAVIGANSVVTGDIPAATIAAGAPARVIREIEFRT